MNPIAFGRPTMKPHPGRRHSWLIGPTDTYCSMCGALLDAAAVKRGRNNRKRGGRGELDIARTYGGEKVGPLGLPEDIRGAQWRTQVKVRQSAPPKMWTDEFAKLDAGRDGRSTRLILRFTRPSVGTEDFIVVRGADWLAWFGKDE